MSANLGTHREKLTTKLVDDLPLPATGMITLWDAPLPGFGLYLSARGKRSFFFSYAVNRRASRIKIGSRPAWRCDDVAKMPPRVTSDECADRMKATDNTREVAMMLKRLVDLREEPSEERRERRDAPTMTISSSATKPSTYPANGTRRRRARTTSCACWR
jgi:hypothetical protein